MWKPWKYCVFTVFHGSPNMVELYHILCQPFVKFTDILQVSSVLAGSREVKYQMARSMEVRTCSEGSPCPALR